MRPNSCNGIDSLPAVGASKEFLEALFAKHNIDGDACSNKSLVDKELRQTLSLPQNEHMVEAVSCAIISHVESCVGQHAVSHGCFDERQHPFTEGAELLQASLDEVQKWLWTILDALKLDPECLIISLVLLERTVAQSDLRVTPFTWRPCILCALVIASKVSRPHCRECAAGHTPAARLSATGCRPLRPPMIHAREVLSVSLGSLPSLSRQMPASPQTWYDKAIFNMDFAERLSGYNLSHINTMETEFLALLDYRATVSMSLYAKYFFALQDVLNSINGTGNARRSTWSAGESGR